MRTLLLLPFLLKQNPSRITCNSHAHFSQTETEMGGKRFKKKIKKIATRTRRRIRVEISIRIPSAIEENDHLLSNRENDEEGWETEGESHLGAGKGLRKKDEQNGAGRKRETTNMMKPTAI